MIEGVVRVKSPSGLLCLLAQCLHCSGERHPGVQPLPSGVKCQSRPLRGLRTGGLSKEAFSLNKYGRVYPLERPLSLWMHPHRLHRTVLPSLPVSIPTVPCTVRPSRQQSLSGPVVIVRGAAGGWVHVSCGWVHVVVVRVSSDTR